MPDVLARSLVSLTRCLTARQEGDAALLARYPSAHDPAAFAELVRRHGPLVLGVCRRMLGHVHDAEDAFQATFLVLARSACSVRKPDALSAWLYGTAVRVCRKARSRRVTPRPLPAAAAAGDDPLAEVAWKEVRGLLDDEVGRLPDALREPLLLCYFEGLTRDEAAEKLGWSRRTLMRRLEQARDRLRRRLESRGVATLGLGAAVLSPRGLAALVPDRLVTAAVAVATGGPVPAGVRALAGGAAVSLLHVAVGLSLLLAGAGLGLAALSTSPGTEPPAALTTDDHPPPPPGQADALDGDGRPLPPGAVHRLGSRRFRIEGRNDFLLPSPDGRHALVHPQPALSAYAAQGLMLVDIDTGLRVRSFEDSRRVPKAGRYDAVRPAVFSPDGKTLYALGWHKSEESGQSFYVWAYLDNPCKRVVLVWDVATGKKTAEWNVPSGGLLGASLLGLNVSPDGKRLYVYGAIGIGSLFDRNVRGVPGLHVLDAATGQRLQTWNGAGYPAGTTAGGKEVIAFRQGSMVAAYDAETGKPVRAFPLAGFVPSVVLSPDGKTVAAVGLAGHPDKPDTCEIKLWEAATGRDVRRLTADVKTVGSASARLAFAADGQTLYLATGSGRILRWDLSDGRALPDWPAHRSMVADLFLRPGKSELVSAGAGDGAIRRWDAATGKALSTTDAYVGEVAVARTPGGKGMIAVDAAGRLDVWDVTTGRITQTLPTPGRKKHELVFTPDGKQLLVAAQTGPCTIWDWPAAKQAGEFAPPPKIDPEADEYWWATLAFSPDGRRLVASKFGRGTWMWAWPERTVLWHEAKEQEACFLDGDTLVCGAWHGEIELRDARTGAVQRTVPGPGLAHLAYSEDRRRLVTAHLDGSLRVRDGSTGEVLKEIKGFQKVWSVAFSPSGWLLAAAGDNSVRVYDTASWQEVARCDGHDGTVGSVFFGPDEATLVSASAEDGTALVWSLQPPAGREPPDPARLWADLAGNGPAVLRAVWTSAQHPDVAVPLFRQKWPAPQHPVDAKQVRKLIAALDSETFADREAAEAELAKLGRQAEAELRQAQAETTSAEVKRRMKKILDLLAPPAGAAYPADEARELRAVWALELAGTPEAKQVLEAWAAAKVGNRLGEAAAAALKRRTGSSNPSGAPQGRHRGAQGNALGKRNGYPPLPSPKGAA
jgi:RNA polymerase sigma factor (sigma-70 family)